MPLPHGARILDIGCGSGAGGLMVARQSEGAELVLNDINPLALRYSRINADGLGISPTLVQGDGLAAVEGDFDLIIANPPYLVDKEARTYRHGGSDLGRSLGLRMATEAAGRLAPGGRLLFYTGVAIVDGKDPMLAELAPVLDAAGLSWRYEEIDPDVFGEELLQPAYALQTGLPRRPGRTPAARITRFAALLQCCPWPPPGPRATKSTALHPTMAAVMASVSPVVEPVLAAAPAMSMAASWRRCPPDR